VQALHKDYIETPGYRALMLAALLTAKQTHIDHLVTGLPVRHMLDKRDALKQLFAGYHQVTPEFSVTIETVHVVPQPLGGLLDFASERHEHYPVRDMTVLVIDPGHFTTDWLIVDGLRAVRRRSDSMETGMAAVIAEIRDRLRRKYGGTPTDAKLIERIETGRDVRVHNQPVHIQPLLAEVAQQVAEPVVQRIKSTVADFDDIDLILLVGGGAAVFEPVVRSVLAASGPEIATAHASVFANVRGYYRFGERAASQVMRASR
jgi:plasmid segregation protein ParM